MSEASEVNPVERVVIREWWKRISFAVEVRFAGIEGDATPMKWLFDYEATMDRYCKRRKVFWPRAWIRILGFSVGVGFYYDYDA